LKRGRALPGEFRQVDFFDDIPVAGRQQNLSLLVERRDHIDFYVAAAAKDAQEGGDLVAEPGSPPQRMRALARDMPRPRPSANRPARPIEKMCVAAESDDNAISLLQRLKITLADFKRRTDKIK
jgi:hypothetical protein